MNVKTIGIDVAKGVFQVHGIDEHGKRLFNTGFRAHRWVVERTHSWMNRFRHVLTRWEKKVENYEAMLHFACRIIVWNKVLIGIGSK